jgi:hypothetical protein
MGFGGGETNIRRQYRGAHFNYPGLVGMHKGTPHLYQSFYYYASLSKGKGFGKETTGLLT